MKEEVLYANGIQTMNVMEADTVRGIVHSKTEYKKVSAWHQKANNAHLPLTLCDMYK